MADLAVLPRLEAALERARPNHIGRFITVRWEDSERRNARLGAELLQAREVAPLHPLRVKEPLGRDLVQRSIRFLQFSCQT